MHSLFLAEASLPARKSVEKLWGCAVLVEFLLALVHIMMNVKLLKNKIVLFT